MGTLGRSWLDFGAPEKEFWSLRGSISTPPSLEFEVSGDRFWCLTSAATRHRKPVMSEERGPERRHLMLSKRSWDDPAMLMAVPDSPE